MKKREQIKEQIKHAVMSNGSTANYCKIYSLAMSKISRTIYYSAPVLSIKIGMSEQWTRVFLTSSNTLRVNRWKIQDSLIEKQSRRSQYIYCGADILRIFKMYADVYEEVIKENESIKQDFDFSEKKKAEVNFHKSLLAMLQEAESDMLTSPNPNNPVRYIKAVYTKTAIERVISLYNESGISEKLESLSKYVELKNNIKNLIS